MIYKYFITKNKNGKFAAEVRDSNEKIIYEVDKNETVSIFEEFVQNIHDLVGLSYYLKELGILPAGANISKGN